MAIDFVSRLEKGFLRLESGCELETSFFGDVDFCGVTSKKT